MTSSQAAGRHPGHRPRWRAVVAPRATWARSDGRSTASTRSTRAGRSGSCAPSCCSSPSGSSSWRRSSSSGSWSAARSPRPSVTRSASATRVSQLWDMRQVAGHPRHRHRHGRRPLLRDPEREAAEVPAGSRSARPSRSAIWVLASARFRVLREQLRLATTRSTARSAASSSSCCGCGSPTSRCSSAPRSTPSWSGPASCRPASGPSTRSSCRRATPAASDKAEEKLEERVAEGRPRLAASRPGRGRGRVADMAGTGHGRADGPGAASSSAVSPRHPSWSRSPRTAGRPRQLSRRH